jgi:GTPase SAR1 family protein
MGILMVYDVSDDQSFNNIRNWMRNIEQHASDNVIKVLVGNKSDLDESKRKVPFSRGQVGTSVAQNKFNSVFCVCRCAVDCDGYRKATAKEEM